MSKFIIFSALFFGITSTSYGFDKLINVTGRCHKDIVPDRVGLDITVEILNMDQQKSSEIANEKYNSILKVYKGLKLKDAEFKTTSYRVYPHKVWENQKQVFKGFKTSISLNLATSETKKAGKLIQVANENKIEQVSGPNLFVSEKLYNSNYNECLKIAVADGKVKANILAKASDNKLKKIISIKESGSYSQPRPMYNQMVMAKSMRSESANIEVGTTKMEVSLDINFSI